MGEHEKKCLAAARYAERLFSREYADTYPEAEALAAKKYGLTTGQVAEYREYAMEEY